jgi:hypothetical protein
MPTSFQTGSQFKIDREVTVETNKSQLNRIALQTPTLDLPVRFFTEVIGFKWDFKGFVEANAEPYLGMIFNIDTQLLINRALISTST